MSSSMGAPREINRGERATWSTALGLSKRERMSRIAADLKRYFENLDPDISSCSLVSNTGRASRPISSTAVGEAGHEYP